MNPERLVRGLRNPKLIGRWLNRQLHTRLGRWSYNRNGADVFEEEWDNLIILDAARFELFEGWGLGELESRESRGASTIEFLHGNVEDRDLRDTVYVSANPHIAQVDARLADTVKCWGGDGWSSMFDTVEPETVTEKALRAAEKYPEKRLVVHYMQPHYPFAFEEASIPSGVNNIWQKASRGELNIDPQKARREYKRNFNMAREEVEELVEGLEGRSVVTSDHGNVFDKRLSPIPVRDWSHPVGVYCEELVKVPWLMVEGERRDTSKTSKSRQADVDEDQVQQKLRDLGYG